MRNLFLSTAAAALFVPLGACADPSDTTAKPDERTETAANNMDEPDAAAPEDIGTDVRDRYAPLDQKAGTQNITYLSDNQMSAKDFLGEGITGARGERIARVDDIVISADGKADSVVFLSGGILGLGGKRGALDFDNVDIVTDREYEPVVRVAMTEEAAQTVAEYETDEANDYRLASELIGASAKLANSDDEATITDLIMEVEGQVRYAVVRDGVIGSLGGEKRLVDFNKVVIEQGDGGVMLDITPAMLENADRFEYWDHTALYENQRDMSTIDQ